MNKGKVCALYFEGVIILTCFFWSLYTGSKTVLFAEPKASTQQVKYEYINGCCMSVSVERFKTFLPQQVHIIFA